MLFLLSSRSNLQKAIFKLDSHDSIVQGKTEGQLVQSKLLSLYKICLFSTDQSVCPTGEYTPIKVEEIPNRMTSEEFIQSEVFVAETLTLDLEAVYREERIARILSKDTNIRGYENFGRFEINDGAVLTIKMPTEPSDTINVFTLSLPQDKVAIDGTIQFHTTGLPLWAFEQYKDNIVLKESYLIVLLDIDIGQTKTIDLADYNSDPKLVFNLLLNNAETDEYINCKLVQGKSITIGSFTIFSTKESDFRFILTPSKAFPFKLSQEGLDDSQTLSIVEYKHRKIWFDDSFTPDLHVHCVSLISDLDEIIVITRYSTTPFFYTTTNTTYELPPGEGPIPSSEPTPVPSEEPTVSTICIFSHDETQCGSTPALKYSLLSSRYDASSFESLETIIVVDKVSIEIDKLYTNSAIISSKSNGGKYLFKDGGCIVLESQNGKDRLEIQSKKDTVLIEKTFNIGTLVAPLWFVENSVAKVTKSLQINSIYPDDQEKHTLKVTVESEVPVHFQIDNHQSDDYFYLSVDGGRSITANKNEIAITDQNRNGDLLIELEQKAPLKVHQEGLNEKNKLKILHYIAEKIQFDSSFTQSTPQKVIEISTDHESLIVETELSTIPFVDSSTFIPDIRRPIAEPEKSNLWLILTIVGACVAAVIIAALITLLIVKKRNDKKKNEISCSSSLNQPLMF